MSKRVVLKNTFFDRDAQEVAKALLGKIIFHKHNDTWLSAQIIETEAYYLSDKASHASLGYTQKRKALFMNPGTIYMYHSQGGPSMNISTKGIGNAVLIKSGYPYVDDSTDKRIIEVMKSLNPSRSGEPRSIEKLCSGQSLLCKSLGLEVKDWDQKEFDVNKLYIVSVGYIPKKIIQTERLGISKGRDEELQHRFVDYEYSKYSTKDILRQRGSKRFVLLSGGVDMV